MIYPAQEKRSTSYRRGAADRALHLVNNDAAVGTLEQAQPYRASAVGSWCGHSSPFGIFTQHGPQRWAGCIMVPVR